MVQAKENLPPTTPATGRSGHLTTNSCAPAGSISMSRSGWFPAISGERHTRVGCGLGMFACVCYGRSVGLSTTEAALAMASEGATDRCSTAVNNSAPRRSRPWLRSCAGVGFDRGSRSRHERRADMAGRRRCGIWRRFRRRWS
jgi:hypothetical protein